LSVLSIGTFDGIHIGHRKLLGKVLELAGEQDLRSVIVTYKDHPAFVLRSKAKPKMLCPWQIKEQELQNLGIRETALLNFTKDLAAMSAEDFLADILVARWHPRYIVVGYDSHFGKHRAGNREFLQAREQRYGYEVVYVEPVLDDGKPVSSSRIRTLLESGELAQANQLLGRPYRLLGSVSRGIARGREFGFPTANLMLSNPHQLIPKEGIYLSKVHLGHKGFFGLTNIGKSPTVKHTGIIEIETFLIDFAGDLYGEGMQVELIRYLREEKMFANTDELIQAMHRDLQRARELIAQEQA